MKRKLTLGIVAMLFLLTQAWAQGKTVSGTVTSEDATPLIGVTVLVKNSTSGTITDIDGKYSVEVAEDAVLVFSYTGFDSQEITVGAQSMIDVTLSEGVSLDEVVVTALGISRKKKALGYAVTQLGSDEIANSGSTDVIGVLQGQIPGVQIQGSSGAPGAGASILIRGITSLDAGRSNRPLFVIDGIEVSDDVDIAPTIPGTANYGVSSGSRTQSSVSNRILDINPNDIESISVLRGGAAAALYGVRATNGAIIITTKKGAKGAPQIDVFYGAGWNKVNRTPNVQTQYIDGHRSTSKKRSFLWDNWGSIVTDQTATKPSNVYDDFYQTGSNTSFGASISAGNETFQYRVSGSRTQEEGIVPTSFFNKTNFSVNTQYDISDRLEISASFMYANSESNMPHEGRKSVANVIAYMANTADATSYKEPYTLGGNFAVGIVDHPLFLAENVSNIVNVNRYITGAKAKYKITDGISLNYSLGLDTYSDFRDRRVHPETDEGQSAVNESPNGFTVQNAINYTSYTSNLSLSLHHDVNDAFGLDLLVGYYAYGYDKKRITTIGSRFQLEDFYNLNNALEITQSNSDRKYRNMAAYGELTGSYKDFLYISVTGRNDWSSTLPKANRSYFFPSGSLTWILSDMVDLGQAISFAKLRASYSIVGKDAGVYNIGRYYSRANSVSFNDDVLEYRASNFIGDENLKPEFSKEFEIGAELRFMNNRIGVDATYYRNTVEDMILSVPISNTTGASRYVTNAGSLENNGIELSGFFNVLRSERGLNWTTSANWSTSEGRATEINIGEENPEIVIMNLRGVANKYTLDGKIGDLYASPFLRNEEGRLILDENGLPSMNNDTTIVMGNAFPDFIASWTNSFSIKGFEFSFLWEWKKGGDVVDATRNYSIGNGQLEATAGRHQNVLFNGVTETGEENTTYTEITALNFYRNSGRYRFAPEVYLQDASWIRLRNISLSYRTPKAWLVNSFISEAKITLSANNIYLNTPFQGWDPESNYFGPSSNIYGYLGYRTPQTKSFNFKVNLTF